MVHPPGSLWFFMGSLNLPHRGSPVVNGLSKIRCFYSTVAFSGHWPDSSPCFSVCSKWYFWWLCLNFHAKCKCYFFFPHQSMDLQVSSGLKLQFPCGDRIGWSFSAMVPEKCLADVAHLCWKGVSSVQEEHAHVYLCLLGQGFNTAVAWVSSGSIFHPSINQMNLTALKQSAGAGRRYSLSMLSVFISPHWHRSRREINSDDRLL